MDLQNDSENAPENNTDVLLFGGFEDPKVITKLGTVAAKIAYHNFQWRFVTLVMYNTMLHIGVEPFLKNYNQTVYLKLGKFVPKHRVHVPQFVLFGQETAEIIETLQWLYDNRYDNTGMYILICSSSNYNNCDETKMFQFLSKLYYVNTIFLKGSPNERDTMEFTYYPVFKGNCRNEKSIELKLNCNNDLCFKNLFPEKLENLQKCSFVVSSIDQPPIMYLHNGTSKPSGGDGDILKLLAEILNATLVVTTPESKEFGRFINNNWTGSLGEVFNKRAHASMCSAPLTPEMNGNFQISFTYNSIDIVWAARLPKLKPSLEKLFYPLKIYVRVALFFIFIVIIWMNTFMKTKIWRSVEGVLNIEPTGASLFFYSWVVFLGMPLLRLPSKSTLRIIVMLWIWFCYIFRTAYQAVLVSSMKLQLYEDYLENFKEVLNSRFPYGGLGSLRVYYSEEPEIFNNWQHVDIANSYDLLDSMLNGSSDFVIASNKDFILHHLMNYNGTKRLQIIPEKIVNTPAVMYFKKFNPIKATISRLLSIMMENGIIDHFYAEYLDRGNYLFEHVNKQDVEILSLSQISSTFMILISGWLLSFVYFLVELASKKYEYPGLTVFTKK